MDRFASTSVEDQNKLAENSLNNNTAKSTKFWLNVYKSWANLRGKSETMSIYGVDELNIVLKQFFSEIRKKDGGEYEPDCLRVMQGALHRHLIENNYPGNIMNDDSFRESRNVLEGKARKLREMGMGKKPNACHSLSDEEEEVLWKSKKLGPYSPMSLLHTMWYYNTQYMGLRGCQEHTTMMLEDFEEHVSPNGVKYITFSESLTKTRQGGLRGMRRNTQPKMFFTGGERCPYLLFQLYVSKRPVELRNSGRFYLTPKKNYAFSNEWYLIYPMGKNTISGIMRNIIAGTEIENTRKKITNHSGRKTLVRKLKAAGVPESSIIKVTGHTTTAGLSAYDPEDEGEFQMMSNAVQTKPIDIVHRPISSFSPINFQQNKRSIDFNRKTVFNRFPSFEEVFDNPSLQHCYELKSPQQNRDNSQIIFHHNPSSFSTSSNLKLPEQNQHASQNIFDRNPSSFSTCSNLKLSEQNQHASENIFNRNPSLFSSCSNLKLPQQNHHASQNIFNQNPTSSSSNTPIFNFYNCQITQNMGSTSVPPSPASSDHPKRKRIRIIESSSSEDES